MTPWLQPCDSAEAISASTAARTCCGSPGHASAMRARSASRSKLSPLLSPSPSPSFVSCSLDNSLQFSGSGFVNRRLQVRFLSVAWISAFLRFCVAGDAKRPAQDPRAASPVPQHSKERCGSGSVTLPVRGGGCDGLEAWSRGVQAWGGGSGGCGWIRRGRRGRCEVPKKPCPGGRGDEKGPCVTRCRSAWGRGTPTSASGPTRCGRRRRARAWRGRS